MGDIMIPHKALLVVFNNRRARLLVNEGSFIRPQLVVVERLYAAPVANRSAFIRRISNRLGDRLRRSQAEALIVAGDQKLIEAFHDLAPALALRRTIAEIPADLTGLAPADLADAISSSTH